jgi:hypothetical protein
MTHVYVLQLPSCICYFFANGTTFACPAFLIVSVVTKCGAISELHDTVSRHLNVLIGNTRGLQSDFCRQQIHPQAHKTIVSLGIHSQEGCNSSVQSAPRIFV